MILGRKKKQKEARKKIKLFAHNAILEFASPALWSSVLLSKTKSIDNQNERFKIGIDLHKIQKRNFLCEWKKCKVRREILNYSYSSSILMLTTDKGRKIHFVPVLNDKAPPVLSNRPFNFHKIGETPNETETDQDLRVRRNDRNFI